MRSKVKIQVSTTDDSLKEEVQVWLNNTLCGSYLVDKRDTPIEEALILLGAEKVTYDGDWGGNADVSHTLNSVAGQVMRNAMPAQSLGHIQLTNVYVEGAEEFVVRVSRNGERVGGVSPKLNYRSLGGILEDLGFEVEIVGVS
jgi:hypothetical protein